MSGKPSDRKSDSPFLFLDISESYLRAYQLVWECVFDKKARTTWDFTLILHPISHLLGVSLETAIKGLLVCRGEKSWGHNLVELMDLLVNESLEARICATLEDLEVPEDLIEQNESISKEEVFNHYRHFNFHVEQLNRQYDRPFSTRYPVLGGKTLPDTVAISKIISVIQETLRIEKSNWRPNDK